MAIESPTIPSSLTSISAVELKTTQNNKAFFINSGLIGADNTETTVISVDSVGKRDILICINPIMTSLTDDDMTMKIKNNGSIIYQALYDIAGSSLQSANNQPLHFIIPANTSIEITFTNSDSTSHDVGVSAYGYYLEGFY